jgi:hypothetical protein
MTAGMTRKTLIESITKGVSNGTIDVATASRLAKVPESEINTALTKLQQQDL